MEEQFRNLVLWGAGMDIEHNAGPDLDDKKIRPLLRQSGLWAGFDQRRGSLFSDWMAGIGMMKLTVSQLGKGAGISLSDTEMEVLGLQIGDALEVTQQPDGSLVLRPCYLDQIELAEKIMSEDRDILSKLS